jgi:hypothetical protein
MQQLRKSKYIDTTSASEALFMKGIEEMFCFINLNHQMAVGTYERTDHEKLVFAGHA